MPEPGVAEKAVYVIVSRVGRVRQNDISKDDDACTFI
jgi:hypothetical protein